MNITTETGFKKVLKTITKEADSMADDIHNAGMYALHQVNIHGNWHFSNQLILAMGRKHDKKRVIAWLTFFGKLSNTKDKGLVFRKRKDIVPETVEAWLKRADESPYWEHTPQEEAPFTVDYLSMLLSILHKHKMAITLESEGKPVKESHKGVIAEIEAIVLKHKSEVKEKVLSSLMTSVQEETAAA